MNRPPPLRISQTRSLSLAALLLVGCAPGGDAPESGSTEARPDPLHILLVAGPKTHGPDEHDYQLWQQRWHALLLEGEEVQVDTAWIWPRPEQLDRADVVVFYSANDGWSGETARELDDFLTPGGGAVFIHYAIHGRDAVNDMARLTGLAWRSSASSYRYGPVELTVTDAEHPILRGFSELALRDETYWNLEGDIDRIRVLATAVEEGEPRPQIWTRTHGEGRVLVSIPGHYTEVFDVPDYRLILLRGIAWAAGQPVDRVAHLASPSRP